MKNNRLFLFLAMVAFLGSCRKENKPSHFVLAIGASSYRPDTIDTKVFIDNIIYFDKKIVYENILPNITEISLDLTKGKHKIRIETLNGSAIFDKDFLLPADQMWGLIEFHREDPSTGEKDKFSFYTSDKEMAYL